MCLNLSDMADKQDSSDTEKPLRGWCRPVTLFGPLSHVAVCDVTLTATVRGGVCDLCLTNGSFIILRATSMSPVFIALYFKLNPQQCPSIMVAHDLYWRWWRGPGEGRAQVLSRPTSLEEGFFFNYVSYLTYIKNKMLTCLSRKVIIAAMICS